MHVYVEDLQSIWDWRAAGCADRVSSNISTQADIVSFIGTSEILVAWIFRNCTSVQCLVRADDVVLGLVATC